MYKILRFFLFYFSAETAHKIIATLLKIINYIPFSGAVLRFFFDYRNPKLEREVLGIKFRNPVGLAAGFDKNGDLYNLMSNFGFGFIEIGSLTPEAQEGNPKPRCFRLVKDKALINHMGINNLGVKYTLKHIQKNPPRCVIGGNISKGENVPNNLAAKDLEKSFALLYEFADYFVINVSCPNVKGAYQLQSIDSLSEIIDGLTSVRNFCDDYRPILVKISPDMSEEQLDNIIDLVLCTGLDGIVATNTTRKRDNLETPGRILSNIGEGGLSGQPLFEKSLAVVKHISERAQGNLPIIAVGGISTPQQAEEMLKAGASLIELYTGFIYDGPATVRRINKYLAKVL
ncbi:MAG: quinone-dependent dihydroorotate dehydrogenase [Bacteroidales bacterium]|jgi:dihydroorotate dehydrogenase|nr:quinone-dependent dihydroorotate dehydrogenase [Bacteroidales bacterium]